MNKKTPQFQGVLAGEQGFEPQTSRPERDVMPFHHSPIAIPAGGIVSRHG